MEVFRALRLYDVTADSEEHEEFVNPEQWSDFLLQVRRAGELFGFLSGNLLEDGKVAEIALGMRPDLTGQGLGLMFMRHNLEWIKQAYPVKNIRLAVAAFNRRGITVYERSGFRSVRNFIQQTNGGEHEFVEMIYTV
ncbi:GNAT family N-acetyltransferase [Trueperella sp. LYQ141]|uniref:GNAT family N-acetyltransferase n=1 Tax=Trueperella sp. LYQ141 TaxID=3391058 RepID=UPI00398334D8